MGPGLNQLVSQSESQRFKGWEAPAGGVSPSFPLVVTGQRTHLSGFLYPDGRATEAVGGKGFVQGHLVGLMVNLRLPLKSLASAGGDTGSFWGGPWATLSSHCSGPT